MTVKLRVLLVDDHDLFRTGLQELLGEAGLDVYEADGAESALWFLRHNPVDVVAMDLNMPDVDGVEATRRVQTLLPDLPVLMLTVVHEHYRVLEAIRAGAVGYLLKDAELDDIVAGLAAAARGESPLAPRVSAPLVARLRLQAPEPDQVPDLSRRQREVLSLIAGGLDNEAIAARLYLSSSTVKSHVSKLFELLGVSNRVQAAVAATRLGLVDPSH